MLGAYAQQYRSLWNDHWWWQARKRFILHWIGRLAGARRFERILDIGCGDGLLHPELERFGEVYGIEPDERLISQENRRRERIEVAAFGPGYRATRTFDLILMLHVLEHIEDDVGAMKAAEALLNPGGIVLLTVPALPILWSLHDVANCHFRRYTRHVLGRALRAAGLHVLRIQYYFGWTLLPMLLRRVLAPGTGNSASAGDYHARIPPAWINSVCRFVSISEQAMSSGTGLPIGSSLFAIAVRK